MHSRNALLDLRGLEAFRTTFKAMGSPCEIRLFAKGQAEADRIAAIAIAEVGRLEARYSRYRSESFLSEINRVAGRGESLSVDDETAGLLDYAATCYRESAGLFDITSGILRRAWRFDRGALPDPGTAPEPTPPSRLGPSPLGAAAAPVSDAGHGDRLRRRRQGIRRRSGGDLVLGGRRPIGLCQSRRGHQDHRAATGWQPVADRNSPSPPTRGPHPDGLAYTAGDSPAAATTSAASWWMECVTVMS